MLRQPLTHLICIPHPALHSPQLWDLPVLLHGLQHSHSIQPPLRLQCGADRRSELAAAAAGIQRSAIRKARQFAGALGGVLLLLLLLLPQLLLPLPLESLTHDSKFVGLH